MLWQVFLTIQPINLEGHRVNTWKVVCDIFAQSKGLNCKGSVTATKAMIAWSKYVPVGELWTPNSWPMYKGF